MPQFKKKPMQVEAICITQEMVIKSVTGLSRGKPGDWLITCPSGEEFFVSRADFESSYEPADETAKKYLEEAKNKRFGF